MKYFKNRFFNFAKIIFFLLLLFSNTLLNSQPLPVASYPFNGVIDDVNIYNVALNQSDVNILYANYYDTLANNNTIIIDSVSIEPPDCFNTHIGSIIVYPNSNNAPYQFSINNGVTYQTIMFNPYNINKLQIEKYECFSPLKIQTGL